MENDVGAEAANVNGLTTDQNNQYLAELINERQGLDECYVHAARLLDLEINQAQSGHEKVKLLELHNDRPTKVVLKVKVPANEYPRFNFIGKIIGPKGNSLKRMQEETECRITVGGRGSMRDKEKEEQLRQQGGKYSHLNEDLHVHVESFGHPIDVYRRLSFALHELRRHLVPDYNDEVTQMQVQELAVLKGTGPVAAGRGRGRGASSGAMRGGPYPGQGKAARSRGNEGVNRQTTAAAPPPPNAKPAPEASMTGFSEAYQYEAAPFTMAGFDGQSTNNATDFSQQGTSSFQPAAGARSMQTANSALGFNSQTDGTYDMTSGGWGNSSGGFRKSPMARPSASGQTRNHPYAAR